MKAEIVETFDGRLILADASDPEFSRFGSISDVRKCENVLLDKVQPGCPFRGALIGDEYVEIMKSNFKHPYGGMETVFEVIK